MREFKRHFKLFLLKQKNHSFIKNKNDYITMSSIYKCSLSQNLIEAKSSFSWLHFLKSNLDIFLWSFWPSHFSTIYPLALDYLWNIWIERNISGSHFPSKIERNIRIFHLNALPFYTIIFKSVNILLS